MGKAIKFLKEARAELRKVSWPTWDDVTRSTVVVSISVVLFTLFIFYVDKGVSKVLSWIL